MELIEKDLKHIWHPFTQHQTAPKPIAIVRGEGAFLYTEDGTAYLDAISSWWVNLHGHAHPHIAKTIYAQASTLEHSLFGGFTHRPAVELAEKMLAILPGNLNRVFYADNGSTAVETALKIALQYFHNQGSKRKKILCFENGYHGDTFGAMSVSAKTLFNKPFWDHLFEVVRLPLEGAEKKLAQVLQKEEIAAFIYEPLIFASGGMKIYSEKLLQRLLHLCRLNGVLLIADEVMTGLGRTGSLFASEKMNIFPDIICLSKGLAGGFLPLGLCAIKEEIYEKFLSNDLAKALLHGHTFTGNPIACSAALASLELLLSPACTQQRKTIENAHQNFVKQVFPHPKLKRCEYLGTILVVEYLDKNGSYFSSLKERLVQLFLKRQIIIRPLGNVLYVIPPYCIKEEELEHIYNTILESLE
jgi:adenosylmethionine---8-amino-7-oxononanoate aminotransferase